MAESVVYCDVVMNLDDLSNFPFTLSLFLAFLPESVCLLFLTRPSFLLQKIGTFAMIKLLTWRLCGKLYLLKWEVIYLKFKKGFYRTLSMYEEKKEKKKVERKLITFLLHQNIDIRNITVLLREQLFKLCFTKKDTQVDRGGRAV